MNSPLICQLLSIIYIPLASSASLELSISSKPLIVCMDVAHTHTHTRTSSYLTLPHAPCPETYNTRTSTYTHTARRAGGCVLMAGVGWRHGLGQQGQSHHPCRRCSSARASLPRLWTSAVRLGHGKGAMGLVWNETINSWLCRHCLYMPMLAHQLRQ